MANAHDMSSPSFLVYYLFVCIMKSTNQVHVSSTDPIFKELENINLLKKHTKNQETSSILKVGFALSK